jgi:hypothetical protein
MQPAPAIPPASQSAPDMSFNFLLGRMYSMIESINSQEQLAGECLKLVTDMEAETSSV